MLETELGNVSSREISEKDDWGTSIQDELFDSALDTTLETHQLDFWSSTVDFLES